MYVKERALGKDGRRRWLLRWELPRDPQTGIRRRVHEVFAGGKREAEHRWLRRQAEIEREGDPGRRSAQTVKAFLRDWLPRYAQARDLAPKTQEIYRTAIEAHVIPMLGAIRLDRLRPDDVQAMVDGLMRRGRVRMASMSRRVLSLALGEAVRLGDVATNAAARTTPPKERRETVRHMSMEEIEAVLAGMPEELRAPTRLLALTGLRRGELLGLRWSDLDLRASTARIQRQVVVVNGRPVVRDTPKTEAGRRTVPLVPQAAEIMANLPRSEPGWIFPGEDGGPMRPDRLTGAFRKAARRVGLTWAHPHCLRHTFVSLAIAAQVPIEVVSKIVGHSSVSITSRTYAHLLPGAGQDAAKRIGQYLGQLSGNSRGSEDP